MSAYRELLLGCGHSRTKRIFPTGTPREWQGLVTLDHNPDVKPDILMSLDMPHHWTCGEVWVGLTRENNHPCLEDSRAVNSTVMVTGVFSRMKSDYFDEVHAYEVLEHLGSQGDYRAFFAHFSEIYRILKPGGYLAATCPSRFSPWLWGDPSHRRAIIPESLTFLDQEQYIRQLDRKDPTPMSDFRSIYQADFRIVDAKDTRETFWFVLQAVKPSRWRPVEERGK